MYESSGEWWTKPDKKVTPHSFEWGANLNQPKPMKKLLAFMVTNLANIFKLQNISDENVFFFTFFPVNGFPGFPMHSKPHGQPIGSNIA